MVPRTQTGAVTIVVSFRNAIIAASVNRLTPVYPLISQTTLRMLVASIFRPSKAVSVAMEARQADRPISRVSGGISRSPTRWSDSTDRWVVAGPPYAGEFRSERRGRLPGHVGAERPGRYVCCATR